ncbi:MAG: hypothetical protein V3U96_13125 [Paracoccaceae bacterium]
MKNIFKVKILLASPGNLGEDRKKVSEIINYINLDSGQQEGFVAEIVTWETHSRPAVGDYPQAVVNDQFPDDIDIFIGMMGAYFGTPTKHWGSGTEEEFRIAYKSWEKTKAPEIMFYFSDAMSSVNQIDPEQLSKRNTFRNDLQNLGVYYFVYTDVTEFQFHLLRHISSTIREVLKGKEIGTSEEAIPQESVISLKNYSELLAQDPLVNANTMLGKASDHLDAYNKHQSALTADIGSLAKVLAREAKNINRATRNGKSQKIQVSIDNIYNGMDEYSKKLVIKIPKFSTEFSGAIMSLLRASKMVKDNELEETIPLADVSASVGQTRTALTRLVDSIKTVETGFAGWPEDNLDLVIQKKIISALHQDLVSSLDKSIELLDRLMDELT